MKKLVSDEIQALAEDQIVKCKALRNTHRVLIIWLLTEKEMTIDDIALVIGTTRQNAARHLSVLEFNSFVKSRQRKQQILYSIADNEWTQNCMMFRNKPENIRT